MVGKLLLPLLKPSLLPLPLLGNPSLRQTIHDPLIWAQTVCVSTPVRICEPRKPSLPFVNESAVLPLRKLVVVATQGSPISIATDDHPSAQLLIPYRGLGLWRLERDVYRNPVDESLLYLPPAPLVLENDITSGVALNFDLAALLQTASSMAGPEGLSPRGIAQLQRPKLLELSHPQTARRIRGVYATLLTLDQVTGDTGVDAELLRLDDVLLRLIVLLLLPELEGEPATPSHESSSEAARRKLAGLLGWLEDNLEQPICVSDLEAQAHWSRRSLHQLFRDAYDCTPMQWLRRQRLHRAMQRLKHPRAGDTVRTISRSAGFFSDATFHRAFRHEFGCTPSSVFRK